VANLREAQTIIQSQAIHHEKESYNQSTKSQLKGNYKNKFTMWR
jgi:hypothetical protein